MQVREVAPRYQTGDSQVVVYDFAQNDMFVSFPSPSGWEDSTSMVAPRNADSKAGAATTITRTRVKNVTMAYDMPSTRLDMTALFAHRLPAAAAL